MLNQTCLHQYQEACDTETESKNDHWYVQLPSIFWRSIIACLKSSIYNKRKLVRPALQSTSQQVTIDDSIISDWPGGYIAYL